MTHSDKILIIGDFSIHLNNSSDPVRKAFPVLNDISGSIHLVHEPAHSIGNTLDLIISHGLDASALKVASVSFAVSNTFLLHLKHLQPVLVMVTQMFLLLITWARQRWWQSVTFCLGYDRDSDLAFGKCTYEVNSVLVSLLDSVALRYQDKSTKRINSMVYWWNPKISSWPAGKWNENGEKTQLEVFYLAWRDSVLN